VYYTYTLQSCRVATAMGDAMGAEGWDVVSAPIEFTDPRYAERFARFPLHHSYLDVARMLPPQLRQATGQIRIPDEATSGDYDLVVVGSPTWWLTTCMPIRSY